MAIVLRPQICDVTSPYVQDIEWVQHCIFHVSFNVPILGRTSTPLHWPAPSGEGRGPPCWAHLIQCWWGTRTPMLGPSNTVCLCSKIKCLLLLFITHLTTTTTTVLRPFFRDHPGEPVPEEKFWTLWCKGRLTEADKPSIRLGATPSGLTSAHLHHPPHLLLISAQYNQL